MDSEGYDVPVRPDTVFAAFLRRASSAEEKMLVSSGITDLSANDMHIIDAVGIGYEKNNMSAIAARLGITVGALTTAMNALEEKGYVVRLRGKRDRRVVFVRLTEKGNRVYGCHIGYHKYISEVVREALTDEELAVLRKAYGKLELLLDGELELLDKGSMRTAI